MCAVTEAPNHVRKRSAEVSNDGRVGPASKKLKIKSVDYDEFRPGGLIKLRVENFVTYKLAEFDLSPSLNMIIGPNGSGKSTFVCAVCIGLAGKPKFIGRSNKLEDFIKNGEESGLVEVTLKKPADLQHSPVIRADDPVIKITRRLSRSKRESDYQINDEDVSESLVKSVVSKLNIQLDNLCQFLSQERVASFAALKSEKLLEETARSIDVKLFEVLSRLKNLQEDEREQLSRVNSAQKRIDSLTIECDRLRVTVNSFKDYQKKLKEINRYKKLLPYAHLKSMEEKLREYRAEYEQAKTNLKNVIQEKKRIFETQKQIRRTALEAADHVEATKNRFEALGQDSNRLVEDLKSMRSGIVENKQDIERCRGRINGIQSKVVAKKRELEDKRHQLTGIHLPETNLLERLRSDHDELISKETQSKSSLREIDGKLSNLDYEMTNTREHIKMQRASLQDHDRIHLFEELANKSRGNNKVFERVKDAVLYVRSRPEMRGQVLEPPAMTVSVKRQNYACYLTQCVDFNTRIAFTLTSSQAYNSFGKEILDRFGVNTRELNEGDPKPPLSKEELRKMGFDFYLSEVVTGDPQIIKMLCQNCNIHSIPVSLKELDPSKISRLMEARKNGRLLFPKFIHGGRVVEMGIGSYSHKVWTRDYECVRTTDFFRADAISDEQKTNIQSQISQSESRIKNLKIESEKLLKEKEALKRNLSIISQKSDDLSKRRNELNSARSAYSMIKSTIRSLELEIQELSYSERETLKGRISQCETLISTRMASQTAAMTQLMDTIQESKDCQEQLAAAEIADFEARNMEASIYGVIESYDQREEEFKEDFTVKKQKCREAKGAEWDSFKAQIHAYSADERERLQEFKQRLVDQGAFSLQYVQDAINRLESEMATSDVDESAITILKQKEEELSKLNHELPHFKKALQKVQDEMNRDRQSVEPKLDEVVKNISHKFSELFQEIGSKGHVELIKPDRFADWKIEIKVAFRDNAKLTKLDAQTQSGGERAVSTVLYMIALQQYTSAPFRIVDEINQGMDSHNERIVHKSMVTNACAENTSQYFLITPKLLSGLYYHEKMMIHCVMAGPWIPNPSERPEMVNFGKTSKYVL